MIPEPLPDPEGHLARARQVFAARRALPLPGDPVAGPAGRHGNILQITIALDRPARARVLCRDGITRCVALTLEEAQA